MLYLTFSANQTKALARKLAREILSDSKKNRASIKALKKDRNNAFVIALEGDLGGGKTTFLQGFAEGLGIKEKITSPTFVLMKRFQLNNLTIKQFNNFYHIDCYRINNPREILALGFKEIMSDPKNIVAVEWAEKIKQLVPKDALWLKFIVKDKNKRIVQETA